jgi:hypothetical protein
MISNPMETDQLQGPAPGFAQMVSLTIGPLKKRLQRYYQKAYPDSGEIIDLIIDEEEAKAWKISFFEPLGISASAGGRKQLQTITNGVILLRDKCYGPHPYELHCPRPKQPKLVRSLQTRS